MNEKFNPVEEWKVVEPPENLEEEYEKNVSEEQFVDVVEQENPIELSDDAIDYAVVQERLPHEVLSVEDTSKVPKKNSDTISFKDISRSIKKYIPTLTKNKWIIPILLIVFAVILSTFFRMQPAYLPSMESSAESALYNSYRNQIINNINEEFPTIPEQNKRLMVERELRSLLEANKDEIKKNKNELALVLKERRQDDNGDTYLLQIDPYLWYTQTKNVLEHGYLGDSIIDGKSVNTLRNGRFGQETRFQMHPYIAATWHRALQLFDGSISLIKSLFLLPVFIIAVSLIFIFLLTRKVAGNIGGFFATLVLAISPALLKRTTGGFPDTDMYSILFPLLITWLFIESWQNHKKWLTALSGIILGIYAVTWSGWWYTYYLLAGTVIVFLTYQTVLYWKKHKSVNTIKWKQQGLMLLIFTISSGVVATLIRKNAVFIQALIGPFQFLRLKEASVSLWPKVFRTVKELSGLDLSVTLRLLGGKIFITIAVIGIVYLFTRKKKTETFYAILLSLWLVGTTYAVSTSARFIILLVPPLAIGFGIVVGNLAKQAGKYAKAMHVERTVIVLVVVVGFFLLLIPQFTTAMDEARGQFPGMNDRWVDVLTAIKENNSNGIITSWWDFGHWFTAISGRAVTFDGGDQGERIYWVGKMFTTQHEAEAVGILKMLNCGQEKAPHVLEKHFGGDTLKAIAVLDALIINEKNEAKDILKKEGLSEKAIEEVLLVTHCENLLPQYVITSEDMIIKSQTWGHFGTWDFTKADVYHFVKGAERIESRRYIEEKINVSTQVADQLYFDIQQMSISEFVAQSPRYLTQATPCRINETSMQCAASTETDVIVFDINLEEGTAETIGENPVKPWSLVYGKEGEVFENVFHGQKLQWSLVVFKTEDGYSSFAVDSILARSMFTKLFFFEGTDLACFNLLQKEGKITNELIQSWIVDFSCEVNS